MKTALNKLAQKPLKKPYVTPKLEQVQLDTEISLVLNSPPPPNPQMPQMPEGWVQKIFKLF